ncbi:glutamate 5-kinase [Acinetobacter radioresistens]|uniref:glutamate 5-kinase n=1 Tax=Acinetobacter radioresistens TaxID=40216 RepID=UPI0021CD437C|nr:glutamate 5-kinase [Acinetobacter radioresistens]MCU4500879.1 glutamate 5-kinase [Acinetobacter radioresistens]
MGLRDQIQLKISKAFDGKLSDAITPFNCERITKGNWDPVEETYDETRFEYSGRCVAGSYNQQEIITLGVLATDKKATLLQNEVTAEPLVDDEWQLPDGKYRVMHKKQDPAGVSWTIQLRKV